MQELTFAELDAEMAAALPAKETLFLNNWFNDYSLVLASNSATSANILTFGSFAGSNASQNIIVFQ